MQRIFIEMYFESRMVALAFLVGLFGLLMVSAGPADAQGLPGYGDSCDGTSDCPGNLSCHIAGVSWSLDTELTCECPEPGDGSYSTASTPNGNDYRDVCYGQGVPCERLWDPEYGQFADCRVHALMPEFGQFDSIFLAGAGSSATDFPLYASPDPNSRASYILNGGDRIWAVWCDRRYNNDMWCNIEFNGQNGWVEMRHVHYWEVEGAYPSRGW